MKSRSYHMAILWAGTALLFPVLTGAQGKGCSAGGDVLIGSRLTDGGAGVNQGATPSCQERTQTARQRISAAVQTAEQDLRCQTNADCILADNSSSCSHSCGVVLSTKGAASLAADIEDVNAEVCGSFEEDGCKADVPPCVYQGPAACINGLCARGTLEETNEADSGSNGATCEDKTQAARQRIAAAVEAAQKDLSCQTNADCTFANNSSACSFSCGVVLSVSGARVVQAEIDKVDRDICGSFSQIGCSELIHPCTAPMPAVCSGGICVAGMLGAPDADAGTGSATLSCSQRTSAARERISRTITTAQADMSCHTDADCSFTGNSSECSMGCGVLLSSAGANALRTEIEKVNSEICGSFTADGCVNLALPCTPPQMAACVQGTCADFPPEAWNAFYVNQSSTSSIVSTPPSCGVEEDCTLWKVTPDGKVITSTRGTQTTSSLTAADFSTVDTILRSLSFRDSERHGFGCDAAPSTPSVSFDIENAGGMLGFSVTGCALSGPSGNDAKRLFDVIRQY